MDELIVRSCVVKTDFPYTLIIHVVGDWFRVSSLSGDAVSVGSYKSRVSRFRLFLVSAEELLVRRVSTPAYRRQ